MIRPGGGIGEHFRYRPSRRLVGRFASDCGCVTGEQKTIYLPIFAQVTRTNRRDDSLEGTGLDNRRHNLLSIDALDIGFEA